MSVRTDIAAAVDAIDGISCSPEYVQGTETGLAFVQIERFAYPSTLDEKTYWQVFVMLPVDRAQAERFIEAKAPLLKAALDRTIMWVTEIRAQFTQFEPGGPALPTLVVSGHRETE